MDKLLLNLFGLSAGLLVGILLKRTWRPLLFESWRALFLLIPATLASSSFFILMRLWPDRVMRDGPFLLMSLALLRFFIWSLFFLINTLPASLFSKQADTKLNVMQKLAMLPALLGISGETAVLLVNHGTWPVSEILLTRSVPPAVIAGIRNNAYIFLRLITPETGLPWLGQIWPFPVFFQGLTAIPAISPAELLTAAGFFLIGVSQFSVHPVHHSARTSQ